MDRAKINKINIERLTRWKDRLNNAHATPLLLIGVGHDHKNGQLTICATEERTDQEILLLMKEAVRMLEADQIKQN
jgi:hypothetical protein